MELKGNLIRTGLFSVCTWSTAQTLLSIIFLATGSILLAVSTTYNVRRTGTGVTEMTPRNVAGCNHFEVVRVPPNMYDEIRLELGLPSLRRVTAVTGATNISPLHNPGTGVPKGVI